LAAERVTAVDAAATVQVPPVKVTVGALEQPTPPFVMVTVGVVPVSVTAAVGLVVQPPVNTAVGATVHVPLAVTVAT
jgi:hypothetical protein